MHLYRLSSTCCQLSLFISQRRLQTSSPTETPASSLSSSPLETRRNRVDSRSGPSPNLNQSLLHTSPLSYWPHHVLHHLHILTSSRSTTVHHHILSLDPQRAVKILLTFPKLLPSKHHITCVVLVHTMKPCCCLLILVRFLHRTVHHFYLSLFTEAFQPCSLVAIDFSIPQVFPPRLR